MGFYIIKVEHHWSNQDPEKADTITFTDNQLGALLYKKGVAALCTKILPCEGCKYESRSTKQRPCFDCARIKPDSYESIYEDMQE